MKKYFFVLFFSLITCSGLLYSANVTAFLTYATFTSPAKGPYIETYLSIIGNSVQFVKNANGKLQGSVDISIVFTLNGEIKNAQKYTLNSPEVTDTAKGFPNFIDQQRFALANGKYNMELSIADKNASGKSFKTNVPVEINYSDEKLIVSDIQALESYAKSTAPTILTKSGYDLLPYVSNYFPESIKQLRFYAEIYNSKKVLGDGQKILISYFIESSESKVKLNEFGAFSKQMVNDVNIVLSEFNIESLPSGNYNLVIEVHDKDNKIQAVQRCFFQRQNKQTQLVFEDLKSVSITNTFVSTYTNLDTLSEYIRSLRPISGSMEVQYAENQLKGKDILLMQQYFYNFWKSRDAVNTQIAWLEYYKEVMKVNKEFGTYGLKGYDTDRGRVYLQYGAPNFRTKADQEPSAYPYEIWEYTVMVDKSLFLTNPNNKQSNRKFVFYNPDLVTNKYILIHSDARGEVMNQRWQLLIHERDTKSNNLDDTKAPDHFGGNVDDNYNNPR